jgi:hypothetical protein
LATPAGGPADDVRFVHVAETVYVAACVEQGAHGLEMPVAGGEVQGVSVVSGVARIRIGAVLEQQAHGVEVPAYGCGVQSGSAEAIRFRQMNQASVLFEQAAQGLDVAFGTGFEEEGGVFGCRSPESHLMFHNVFDWRKTNGSLHQT